MLHLVQQHAERMCVLYGHGPGFDHAGTGPVYPACECVGLERAVHVEHEHQMLCKEFQRGHSGVECGCRGWGEFC